MSNTKNFEARLANWSGPVFPTVLDSVQEAWQKGPSLDANLLADMARAAGLRGAYVDAPHHSPQTNDGYKWFAYVEARAEHGTIRILFPWRKRMNPDRHIAMYIRGDVSETERDDIAAKFSAAFLEKYEEHKKAVRL